MAVRPRPVRWLPEPGAEVDGAGLPGIRVLLGILPLFTMATVAGVDVIAGPGVGFLPLLSLGPALAAVSLRPALTACVGGLAMALCAVLAAYDGLSDFRRLIALATVVGVTAAGAVASAGRHRRERELANVSAVAEAAQRVLLRPVPTQIGTVGLAVRYMSAAAAARIGGDLYEAIAARGKVRLIVGDVQGKGLAAVQTAAAVLGAFREAAHDAADLGALAERIEMSLQRQAAAEEEFVTAILAQIPEDGSRIEILNCGHPPPLLRSGSGGRFIEPSVTGLPFGLAGLAEATRVVDVVTLRPGDQILFYTDGISEARDRQGAFYRLSGGSALLDGLDPGMALDRLCADVIGHVGHKLRDDAAVLLISCTPREPGAGSGQASAGHAEESVGRSFDQAPGQGVALAPGHAGPGGRQFGHLARRRSAPELLHDLLVIFTC